MIFLGLAVLACLIFLRFFWVLIQWEVRWDVRMLEFGIHSFLLGALTTAGFLLWKHLLIL